jgi:hypothetical protein
VPWAFVKASFLTVDVQDAVDVGSAFAWVLTDDGQFGMPLLQARSRIFLPLGRADVVAYVVSRDDPAALVAEDVVVEGDPVVRLAMGDAQYTVAADTTDAAGGALHRADRDCVEAVLLAFPSGGKVSFEQHIRFRANRVRFSRFSSRVGIHLMDRCGATAENAFYATLHEPRRGLDGDVISVSRPQWRQQQIEFPPTQDGDAATAAVALMRFAEPQEKYYLDGGTFYIGRGTAPSLTFHYTPAPTPEADVVAVIERLARECVDETQQQAFECPTVSDLYFHVGDTTLAIDWDVFATVSPMAYEASGEALRLGTQRMWPYVRAGATDVEWGAIAEWRGPIGEKLGPATVESRVTVRDAAGRVLASGRGGVAKAEKLPPGRYAVEVVDTTPAAGRPARAVFAAEFDSSKEDALVPIFTGMRVVDENGRAVTAIGARARAALLFSAADVQRATPVLRRVAPREALTRVEWRAAGTTTWRPLVPTIEARQYQNGSFLNAGVGTMFRVDLSAVTAEARGAIDLRVRIEDDAGNTSELQLEPAFVVSSGRTRAVRH